MNTIIFCAFFATLLPYLAKLPLALAMNKEGKYDNNYPREQQSRLTGFGARALAAHQNSFESLIIFTMAVAVTLTTNTVTETVQWLAVVHVISRIVYCVMYYINQDKLRSLTWFIATGCSLAMIWQALAS